MSTILVVDDHADNRQLLRSLLAHRNHRVLEAADGQRGLEIARAERPDLVIADVLMPVMDGYEFVRRLRDEPAIGGTEVIFYTANYLEREARDLAAGCGVGIVLTKPSEPDVILATVDRALANTATATGAAPLDFERQHLQLVTDKLAGKVAALEVASARMNDLVALSRDLAGEEDPQRLVAAFCREARRIVGARIAAAGILAEGGAALRQLAIDGGPQENSLSVTNPRAGILGVLLDDDRPHRTGTLNPALAAGLIDSHRPSQSFMGVSIRSGATVHGWLYFTDKVGGTSFTDDDERVAALLASGLAVAYESARRFERISRHAGELEARVTERTEDLARSNADLAQFAYVASHDLQEPLRMVASYTELLAQRYTGRLDAAADDFIGYAADGARRMQQLIRDLLSYSRLESQKSDRRLVPLDRVLDQALENLAGAIAESHATIVRGPLPVVEIVDVQFMQLFQNLIGNAIKFRSERAPTIRIAAEQTDDGWTISVADDGIGISPEFAERVFVVFQRLHTRAAYPGTGMGLAICKRIVERHGGRISAHIADGGGAVLKFTVPAAGTPKHHPRTL